MSSICLCDIGSITPVTASQWVSRTAAHHGWLPPLRCTLLVLPCVTRLIFPSRLLLGVRKEQQLGSLNEGLSAKVCKTKPFSCRNMSISEQAYFILFGGSRRTMQRWSLLGWLFFVARNHAARRSRTRRSSTPPQEAEGVAVPLCKRLSMTLEHAAPAVGIPAAAIYMALATSL